MPKGKMKRYVNFIIGILIIFTIISPITKLNNISLDLDREVSNFTNKAIPVTSMSEIQEEQIKELYMTNLKNELTDVVEKNFNYMVENININIIPDKEQIFVVDSIDLILRQEFVKKDRSQIKIDKVEVGKDTTEAVNLSQDDELKAAIANYINIDLRNINILIKDEED
jgi:stage III sporulation protein AF